MFVTAKTPPDHAEAVTHLSTSYRLHAEGKGPADRTEHMRAGNALAQSLRRLRRHGEAAEVFIAVSRLNSRDAEKKYEQSRCATWKENRPATAVSAGGTQALGSPGD